MEIGSFSWVEEIHESHEGQPSVLDAGSSSTVFQCENWVSFSEYYFMQIKILMVEKGSFCSKVYYSAELKKRIYLYKENPLY
jgi:hypothetical protein